MICSVQIIYVKRNIETAKRLDIYYHTKIKTYPQSNGIGFLYIQFCIPIYRDGDTKVINSDWIKVTR
jgi:hypothetical protein